MARKKKKDEVENYFNNVANRSGSKGRYAGGCKGLLCF